MTGEFENVRSGEPKTRKQRRQARVAARAERIQKRSQKQNQESAQTGSSENRPTKKRLIPIWLRLLIVAILVGISITVGVMVGYGVIGDGEALDALKISTWKHLLDLIIEGTN